MIGATMIHTYEVVLDIDEREFVCDVEYTFFPGDPGSPDCQPTGPEIELNDVSVREITLFDGTKISRNWLRSHDYTRIVDKVAWETLDDMRDALYDKLCQDSELD